MKEKWNNRYGSEEYYFGKEPNEFFKNQIEKLKLGRALFIGDGEGRNSVYAAKIGWKVDCIDISDIGKEKAEKLAKENNAEINYKVTDAIEYNYPKETYDAIVIIYFHVEEELREKVHKKISETLKNNGVLIFLVYEKEHLKLNTNGPSSLNLLYSLDNIVEDFIDFEFIHLRKEKISKMKNSIPQEAIIIEFVGKKIN